MIKVLINSHPNPMKKFILSSLIALSLFGYMGVNINQAEAKTRVSGYTTKRGTYVAPHYRSSPDRTKYNNYSSKGNYNPYTGKKGSVKL